MLSPLTGDKLRLREVDRLAELRVGHRRPDLPLLHPLDIPPPRCMVFVIVELIQVSMPFREVRVTVIRCNTRKCRSVIPVT